MSKKKKAVQGTLSPQSYLKSGSVRRLEVYDCLVAENWEELKEFPVVVARRHANGNITFASFLVDLLCTGVKDAWYEVDITYTEYLATVAQYELLDSGMQKVAYEFAHHIVWGAYDFAASYHIEPHEDFAIASMVLEVSIEEASFMKLPLGQNDKPFLILYPDDPRNSYYLQQLAKYAGDGNYVVMDAGQIGDSEWAMGNLPSTAEEWSSYLLEAKIHQSDNEIGQIYRKCIYEPAMAGRLLETCPTEKLDKMVTHETIQVDQYPEEQLETLSEIYSQLHQIVGNKKLKDIISKLQDYRQKWPENAIIVNYLCIAYELQGKPKLLAKTIHELRADFPEYFFGKIAYAKLLLSQKQWSSIPAVFNNKFTITDAFPDRDVFHISEFMSFNTLMGTYFLAVQDSVRAFTYFDLICALEWPDTIEQFEGFLEEMESEIFNEVKGLVRDLRSGDQALEDILTLLMQA